jgi:4-hydroxy-2-oxoheptanedioate aldolase
MSLKSRLAAGETLFTAWSGVPDPLTVELVAGINFDAVTLDMQHGGHHEDSVLRSIPAITRAGRNALVRIPVGRFDMASRALDFGAEAVIAPMVNSLADARAFAAAMKYPPLGERSWGPTWGFPRSGVRDFQTWLETANTETLALAMIETRPALEAVDGILATPGIDGVFLGPSDFSIAWSGGAVINALLDDMMEAVAGVAKKAREMNKAAAIFLVDPKLAGRFAGMGYQLMAMGNEARYMALGAEGMLATARAALAQPR